MRRRRNLAAKNDLSDWRVIGNLLEPEGVPVTLEEVDVFDRWLSDRLDEMFGLKPDGRGR